jgi:hypothetical protein
MATAHEPAPKTRRGPSTRKLLLGPSHDRMIECPPAMSANLCSTQYGLYPFGQIQLP